MSGRVLLGSTVALISLAGPMRTGAADFIRGDVNGDGIVSMADAYYLTRWLWQGGPAPECLNSADIHDLGDGNLFTSPPNYDLSVIFSPAALKLGAFPRAPKSTPGADPTPNSDPRLTCDSYGSGTIQTDAAARITVLDAVAAGGVDDRVRIRIAISNSTEIVGYRGSIYFEGGVAAWVKDDVWHADGNGYDGIGSFTDLTGTLAPNESETRWWPWPVSGFNLVRIVGNRLHFGFLNSTTVDTGHIPPGNDVDVAEITVCLNHGTRAGTYSMVLEDGELVDAASARSISVTNLQGGQLTVSEDLAADKGCVKQVVPTEACQPGSAPEASFRLESANAAPGTDVFLPFKVYANASVSSYTFSIDFDEEVLEAVGLEPVHRRPDGADFDFEKLRINNSNNVAGSAGVDEGYVSGMIVFSFLNSELSLPADNEQEMYKLHFRVRPHAESGTTEVRFVDGGITDNNPTPNAFSACDDTWYPDTAGAFIFGNAVVGVVPDVGAFVRGDSNGDEAIDLSDAQTTLSFLFLGGKSPSCYDAADANDDGRLDVSDPVAVLQFLFLGGLALPAPTGEPGEDPTSDSLGCLYRT